MHIVFVTASMAGGGSERVIAALSGQFVQMGHAVTILMTAGEEIAYKLNNKVEVFCIGTGTGHRLGKRIGRITALRKYFKKNRTSLIISFGTETNLFSILAAFGLKQRLILSERNDPDKCDFIKLRDFIYFFGKAFAFQTEDALNCFPERIRKRSTVIPNPVMPLPEPYEGERNKNIAAVGRLTAQKNHALLLNSFAQFAKEEPEYKLVIYGKGELEEELKSLANKLGIYDKVVFAGFKENVIDEIKDCGMYVLSSDYEGISNSLMEAMAMGLPVVATDCPAGGARLCIENEVNGILVPMKDKEKLYRAMKKIVKEPEFASTISRNAVLIREKFSVNKIAQMWLDFGETI